MKKDSAKDTSKLPSMKDLANTLKIRLALQEMIFDFYKKDKRFYKKFEDVDQWKTFNEIFPFHTVDMDDYRRVVGATYTSALKAKNKKQQDIP